VPPASKEGEKNFFSGEWRRAFLLNLYLNIENKAHFALMGGLF